MNKKHQLDIHIAADFGSEWQEELHAQTLNLMIFAWVQSVKSKHKKNKIFIDGEEV